MRHLVLRQMAYGLILCCSLALLLTGCDLPWQSKPSDLAKNQTLKMAWNTIDQPDPAFPGGPGLIQLENLLFDGLVTVDRNGHVEPWGAKSWTISPDGLTYTFRLRPNQRFSDGAIVKPSDYARSMDRSANPCVVPNYLLAVIKDGAAFGAESCDDANRQPHGAIQTLVGDSIVPDDSANTLAITLAQPAGYFLATLTNPAFFALERSIIPAVSGGTDTTWAERMSQGKTGHGGSGMFYVASQTAIDGQTDATLTLKPNPYWWGRHAGKTPHFSEIDIQAARSPEDAFSAFANAPSMAFSSGVVDLPPQFPLAATSKQSYYHEQPLLAITVLQLNWRTPPFDDINGRKAFCLAINRDQINEQVLQSAKSSTWSLIPPGAESPTWSLVPQGLPDYNTETHGLDNAPVTGNVALAREYWQRYTAAHPNQRLDLDLAYVAEPDSANAQIMSLLQDSWNHAFGINLKLMNSWGISPPGGSQVQVIGGSQIIPPLNLSGWYVDYPDPQNFLSILYASAAPFNTSGGNAKVPAADALMRQADALPDLNQRIPLYQQAEQLLIDNVAACPLYQAINRYALRPWVKGGFAEDARGLIPNDAWVTGYIAKH